MEEALNGALDESTAHGASRVRSAVLCVDLDGTLLKTDTLYETLLAALKARPRIILQLPFWLARGRHHLKQALAREVHGSLNPSSWPRQAEVELLIAEAKSSGKTVELISAADQTHICDLPLFRQMFDEVIGSSDGLNLKGEAKARLLRERHPDGFAYVGDSAADLPVWRAATERFGVNVPPSVRRRAAREGIDLVELVPAHSALPGLIKSMRPHQWLKNLLVLVPLVLLGPRAELSDVFTFLCGFLLFGLLTSGTYVLNDIFDVESDRKHPRKRLRPIASGNLPFPLAAVAAVGLIAVALAGSLFLNATFAWTLLAYLALTLSYSLFLKRIPLVDVLAIASLFTLRIVAGMTLVGLPPSEWLLIFSIFFFFSLALMKREVELGVMGKTGAQVLQGRGYAIEDRTLLLCFGAASGVASLVVFALFISSMMEQPSSPYATPQLLWGAMAALSYWIMRMWLLTVRGLMDDDPILYAARERASLILAGLIAAFVLAAQLVHL
ncbi:MAG TPA: UbiA family prenyltransferase [Methyloceanibacter sp.]|nr:UbiA family prenyltransferase [Methyloceanibacter sp.]